MSPQKTEAHAVAAAMGFGDQTSIDTANCACFAAERKSLTTLQAYFALEGYALHRTEDGLLLVDRVGRARQLDSVDLARQVLSEIRGVK